MSAASAPSQLVPQRQVVRLYVVDALRAVAVLLVVLYHSPPLSGPLIVLRPFASIGFCGVGLFLVLSGFSIHYRWAAAEDVRSFRQVPFWRRRFMRLYPTYIAAAFVALVITELFLGGPQLPPAVIAAGSTPLALALLSQVALVFTNIVHTPMIGVSWSLGLEVQLYAIYSVVVRHIRRIGVVRIVFGALVVALFWNIASELITRSIPPGQYLPGHKSTDLSHLLYAQAPSRAFEWLLGMLAAEAYHGRVKLPGWTESAYVAVPLAACFGLTFVHPVGALTLGGNGFMASDVVFDALGGVLFFVCLRWICRVGDARLFASRLTARPLRGLAWLGLISYSVYLLHIVMLDVAEKVFGDVGLHGWEQVPFDWVAAIGGCWLFFLAVETRFLVGSKRRATEPRRQRAPVVAAPAVAAPPVAVTPAAAGRRTGTP